MLTCFQDGRTATSKLFAGLMAGIIIVSLTCISGQAGSLPERAYISGVSGHPQSFNLSCESRSAADWAAYWGVNISEWEFQSALPRADNPDEGFVGDPNDPIGQIPPASYGVHAAPVAALLRTYGFEANAERGITWDDLRYEIAAGRPVIVWVIGLIWPGTPIIYTDADGHETTVAHFEHTMILIGYDAEQAHLVDAYTGWTQTYALESFLASWAVLGNMAVTGYLPTPATTDASPATNSGFYIVQRGDYLIALAERFGVSWQDLAALNHIVYPYMIYAGQRLEIPGGAATPLPAPALPDSYRLFLPVVAAQPSSEPMATPVAEQELPTAYIVQRGDYLKAIAEQFGLDWQQLAALNGIPYPYTIYPGQVLRLR